MARLYDHEPSQAGLEDDPFRFSDDEDEFNYYTDSDGEDFEKEEDQQTYSKFRAFIAMMVPLVVSGSIGLLLHNQ